MFYFPNLEILTSNNTLWGVIGPQSSEVAVPTAKLLGLFKLPQVITIKFYKKNLNFYTWKHNSI